MEISKKALGMTLTIFAASSFVIGVVSAYKVYTKIDCVRIDEPTTNEIITAFVAGALCVLLEF